MDLAIIKNISHLIIFLPLMMAFLCLLVKKSASILFFLNNLFVIILTIATIFLINKNNITIDEFTSNKAVSLTLNYSFNLLNLIFIFLIAIIYYISSIFIRNMQNVISCNENKSSFYALSLLNFFTINGILTSNNIVNIYFFIEIYSLSFFALSYYSKNVNLHKISFRYLCSSLLSSILLLFLVAALIINFNQFNFSELHLLIQENLKESTQILNISLLYIIFLIAVILKFLPFWINFNKIKISALSSHLSVRFLFVKILIAIYLIFKFSFHVFGDILIFKYLNFDILVPVISLILISYSAFKIIHTNNLRSIISYFCLINLSFIFICLILNNDNSLLSLYYFIIHYAIIGLFLVLISWFIFCNIGNYNLSNLAILINSSLLNRHNILLLVLFLCFLPISFIFKAYLYLLLAITSIFHGFIIILTIFISTLSISHLSLRLLNYSYFSYKKLKKLNNLHDNIYYLISVIIIYLIMIFNTILTYK